MREENINIVLGSSGFKNINKGSTLIMFLPYPKTKINIFGLLIECSVSEVALILRKR